MERNKPETDKNTSLIQAILFNNTPRVKQLLDAGADPNTKDEEGHPAICHAADRSSSGILKLLIDHGADVNSLDPPNENTPLILAVRSDKKAYHEEKINMLLDAGADPEITNVNGISPLLDAAYYSDLNVFRILFDALKDPGQHGIDALNSLALQYFHRAIAQKESVRDTDHYVVVSRSFWYNYYERQKQEVKEKMQVLIYTGIPYEPTWVKKWRSPDKKEAYAELMEIISFFQDKANQLNNHNKNNYTAWEYEL